MFYMPTFIYKNEYENKMALKQFIKESMRVLKITKKPTKEEYKTIVKVSGLGIIIIGMLGFLIQVLRQVIF